MKKLIFDVDGTLTPSRGLIDPDFSKFLQDLPDTELYLVTGSDRPKTLEQVGEDLYNKCIVVYQCSGNEMWHGNTRVHKNDWIAPIQLIESLTKHLKNSPFVCRTGNHIEQRVGMVNFSIVGRNCNLAERKLYVEYDKETLERAKLSAILRNEFPTIEFKVAGETGLDIFPAGANKSQIMKDFNHDDKIYFFGDMWKPGGNDYEIYETVSQMERGFSIGVTDWKNTWNILKNM